MYYFLLKVSSKFSFTISCCEVTTYNIRIALIITKHIRGDQNAMSLNSTNKSTNGNATTYSIPVKKNTPNKNTNKK